MSFKPSNVRKRFAWGARLSAFAAAALLGACGGPSSTPDFRPLAPAEQVSPAAPKTAGEAVNPAAAYQANPADPTAALAHARALRATNKAEALAVLDRAAAGKPGDRRLQLERGLLALELGDAAKAEKLLRHAHDPKAPDWRLHSALGAALASRGKQQAAQVEFAKALTLAPDQPSVVNNLALSYALDGKVEEGEKLLRKAARSAGRTPQVQENLALVLGLHGRYEEARSVGQTALPPIKADENVAYLRQLDQARIAARTAASASLPQPTYQLGGPLPAE